jgi:hypothetical protein
MPLYERWLAYDNRRKAQRKGGKRDLRLTKPHQPAQPPDTTHGFGALKVC